MKTPLFIIGIAVAVAVIATGLFNLAGLPLGASAIIAACIAGVIIVASPLIEPPPAENDFPELPPPSWQSEVKDQRPPSTPVNHDASALGAFAFLAFVVGAGLVFYGLTMDTSVATSIGNVHNLALGEERMIALGGGAVAFVIGTILMVAATAKK